MIKSLTGRVKYTPHKQGSWLTIPFKLESLELLAEPKSSEEYEAKKNLTEELSGLYEVTFSCFGNPDISLGDRITIHTAVSPCNKDYLLKCRNWQSFRAEQIDVLGDNKKVASYYSL